ncbi:MAG TPA: alpha/beta fold hydrolase [Ramlibacter sp.]|nr:alpha/beta fold hydrolase [Ramlibacter sp.]
MESLQLACAATRRAGLSLLMVRGLVLALLLSLAATLANALPLALFPSTFGDGTQVDTAVLGNRIPVVFVHGLGGGSDGWNSILRAYEQNPAWRAAFKPYSFNYPSTQTEVTADPAAPRTLTALGGALRDLMQGYYDKPAAAPDFGFGNKRVIVVAHSMGGLVARSMMQEHVFRDGQRGGQKVLHLITLGTPHHGTPLSDLAFQLGLSTVSEIGDGYSGFVAQTTWTNFDGLDMSGGQCNPWLAQLNNYAPSTGATYGRCGAVAANPLPGYYEKIIAYGAHSLQSPDIRIGTGVFKPGSSTSLLPSFFYLRDNLSITYPNDGITPMTSAQFNGPALWQRAEAFDCDHRYMKDGYPEFVRSATATYTDLAFCAGTGNGASYASGISGGFAVSGSILGVPGGIMETIRNASEIERVLNWGEKAFAGFLQPSGATTEIWNGYYYRYYPGTNAYAGVKDGNVYYRGPTDSQPVFIAPLANFLAQAQAAGF